jgi:hypothetical protein
VSWLESADAAISVFLGAAAELRPERGRKPGSPKTGGRKAGTPNMATREIKELAMQFVPSAIEQLGAMSPPRARLFGLERSRKSSTARS